MKYIELTQGFRAKVDDEDFESLNEKNTKAQRLVIEKLREQRNKETRKLWQDDSISGKNQPQIWQDSYDAEIAAIERGDKIPVPTKRKDLMTDGDEA